MTTECCSSGISHEIGQDEKALLCYCDCVKGQQTRYKTLPVDMASWSLDNFPGQSAGVKVIREWLQQRDLPWLVLMGPYGRGKTSLGVAAMKEWIDGGIEYFGETAWIMNHGKDAQFWPIDDLNEKVKGSFNDQAENPLPYLRDTCRFLVLDDIEKIRGTPFEENLLNQLLARRHDAASRKRTIITTNKNREQLSDFFGGWVWERVQQKAMFLSVTGANLRREG